MLNFSRNNDPGQSPLPETSRKWIEQSFEWLLKTFGEEAVRQRKVLIPHHTDFPIRYNGEIQTAHDTLSIIASAMEVDPAEIHLDFYSEGPSEISKGSVFGDNLYMKGDENAKTAAGLYWGREEDGKYHIWLESKNLSHPEGMVATLAHEIAHIKLLGENRIEVNDEPLTDLTTILFGVGIFNANMAFQFYNNFNSWGYSNQGYLKQREWGYGLALFAAVREEKEPAWIDHLTKNIRSDFIKSQHYLAHCGKG